MGKCFIYLPAKLISYVNVSVCSSLYRSSCRVHPSTPQFTFIPPIYSLALVSLSLPRLYLSLSPPSAWPRRPRDPGERLANIKSYLSHRWRRGKGERKKVYVAGNRLKYGGRLGKEERGNKRERGGKRNEEKRWFEWSEGSEMSGKRWFWWSEVRLM